MSGKAGLPRRPGSRARGNICRSPVGPADTRADISVSPLDRFRIKVGVKGRAVFFVSNLRVRISCTLAAGGRGVVAGGVRTGARSTAQRLPGLPGRPQLLAAHVHAYSFGLCSRSRVGCRRSGFTSSLDRRQRGAIGEPRCRRTCDVTQQQGRSITPMSRISGTKRSLRS
jgi:hypothetical protein